MSTGETAERGVQLRVAGIDPVAERYATPRAELGKMVEEAEKTEKPDVLGAGINGFYILWAALTPSGIVLLAGVIVFAYVQQPWVWPATAIAALLALIPGVLLARFLWRYGKGRGGMAGSMAAHATPDLDDEPEV